MQPGKPQGVGTWQDGGRQVPTLSFPCNPVSVFVSAWLFLKPLLHHLAGRVVDEVRSRHVTADSWKPPVGREQYLPVQWTDAGIVRAHRLGSGSHPIASLHLAQGLAIVPAEVEQVRAGAELEVIDLRAEGEEWSRPSSCPTICGSRGVKYSTVPSPAPGDSGA